MKKIVLFISISVFLFLVLVLFRFLNDLVNPKVGQLSVTSGSQNVKVRLDGKEIGQTPFFSKKLPLGQHTVEAELTVPGKEPFRWKTSTTLTEGTLSTLELSLAPNQRFSAGESLYFRPGSTSLSLITRPDKATLTVNGKDKGLSPKNMDLEEGVHSILVSKEGFIPRELAINIEPNFKLSATIYLAVNPFEKVAKLDSNSKLSLFSLQNSQFDLSNNSSEWVEGVKHLQTSLPKIQTKFDVLIDKNGKVYILDQNVWKQKETNKTVGNIGFLARKTDTSLTEAAQESWLKIKSSFE